MSNPLLSICIPTFNRANYLDDTLNSIVSQNRFQETNDIEIVISDNCSEDNTKEVSERYKMIHFDKINYFRNSENIKDANFEKALSHGKGLFLKLNNDTLKHLPGSLDFIISSVNENVYKKNILFFSNKVLNIKQNILCENLDKFVETVSFWSGWVGAFGIWKEDFITLKNFSRYAHLQLTQIDVQFRLINSKRSVFVNNEKLFVSIPPKIKGGYDILTVFLDNYTFLLTEQLKNNTLREEVFLSEKRKLLLQFIRSWLVNIRINPNDYTFEYKNSFRRIVSHYKKDKLTLIKFILILNISIYYNLIKKVLHLTFVNPNSLK